MVDSHTNYFHYLANEYLDSFSPWCGICCPEENAPLSNPSNPEKKFLVLRGKLYQQTFWTTNGPYRSDWYEEIMISDSEEECIRACGF